MVMMIGNGGEDDGDEDGNVNRIDSDGDDDSDGNYGDDKNATVTGNDGCEETFCAIHHIYGSLDITLEQSYSTAMLHFLCYAKPM